MSFVAGQNPMRVRFLVPAIVIEDHDIDAALNIVKETIDVCHKTHKR